MEIRENEFEYILLKNLLSNGVFFNKTFSFLQSKFFQSEGPRKIFNLIKDYYKEYNSVPTCIELVSKIKDTSNSELRKELAQSLKQVNDTEIVNNTEFLCDETLKFAKDALYLEALTIGAEGLQNKSDDLKLKAQRILDERAQLNIDDKIGIEFSDSEEMIKYFSERNLGILTQHKELNKRLGTGFLPGTLSVILAGQSVGKSLMMCDLISGMLMQNKNILMVSLEMSQNEMMKRIYANCLDIDVNHFSDLSKNQIELEELKKLGPIVTKETIQNKITELQMSGKLGKFFVKDYPTGSFSALQLEALVQKFQIEKNIKFDCIFIDYLGIMKSDLVSPNAGLYSYLKSIGEEVRASAKKLNVAIISANQLNRGATNKVDDVDNSAISDSLGTAMTADFLLFLLQNEEMKAKSEIVCKITKNRFNGKTDIWVMGIDYPKMRFFDIEKTNGQTFTSQEQKENYSTYANNEVKEQNKQDFQNLKKKEAKDDIDSFLNDLGIS